MSIKEKAHRDMCTKVLRHFYEDDGAAIKPCFDIEKRAKAPLNEGAERKSEKKNEELRWNPAMDVNLECMTLL